MERRLTEEHLRRFADYLAEAERSPATRAYYLRVLREFAVFAGEGELTKGAVIGFKERLVEKGYAPGTVNVYLSALGAFLDFAEWPELKVKHLKLQPRVYAEAEEVLTREEYERLLAAAGEDARLRLLTETLAGTGIRVSELRFFTVEAVDRGSVTVTNKGKTRKVLLPGKLYDKLLSFARERGIRSGPVFRTRTGRPLSRGYIWALLKGLARKAGVAAEKVFPHNLRKLFARCFHAAKKDVAQLADVLGHSSINTTRLYLMTSVEEHRKIIDLMGLVTC